MLLRFLVFATFIAIPSLLRAGIDWDPASLALIEEGGTYGRMIELPDGNLLCAYSKGPRVFLRRSQDGGRSWQDPVLVAEWTDGSLTNAEILLLKDGSLLYAFNGRPFSAFGEKRDGKIFPKTTGRKSPFFIGTTRSSDGGKTWGKFRTIYSGGPEFFNGCWEPSAIQLPSGEIQLFFANEAPYRRSEEQEIDMVRSFDGGLSWKSPEKVSFRRGSRDGMPVPLVLQKNAGIAVAIEDNGLSGNFKPSIFSSTIQSNWRAGMVTGDSPRRWGALASPLPSNTYAGAPYLRQLRSGETVLSYQQREGDGPQRIVVCVGDSQARNFEDTTYPFSSSPGYDQYWAALCARADGTVIALCDTTIEGKRGLWCICGRLISLK